MDLLPVGGSAETRGGTNRGTNEFNETTELINSKVEMDKKEFPLMSFFRLGAEG